MCTLWAHISKILNYIVFDVVLDFFNVKKKKEKKKNSILNEQAEMDFPSIFRKDICLSKLMVLPFSRKKRV